MVARLPDTLSRHVMVEYWSLKNTHFVCDTGYPLAADM